MPLNSGSEEASNDQMSEPEATDHGKMWIPSSSEPEDFGDAEGADADGKWDVEIIGEEVAMNGWGRKPDIRYEAQWKNWARADGTNVTWTNELLHVDDIKLWTRKEAERRRKLAEESTDIDVSILSNVDVHLIQTQYRQHAVEEKLKKHAAQRYVNMEEWTRRNMDLATADEDDADESEVDGVDEGKAKKHSKKSSKLREHMTSAPSSSKRLVKSPSSSPTKLPSSVSPSSSRKHPRTSSTAAGTSTPVPVQKLLQHLATASWSEDLSSSHSTSTMSSSPKVKGKQKATRQSLSFVADVEDIDPPPFRSQSSHAKGKKRAVSPSSTREGEEPQSDRVNKRLRVNKGFFGRKQLEKNWSAVARKARAAAIKITNDVDDEEIPPLMQDFQYIESGYCYSRNIPTIEDKDIFVRCECRPSKKCTIQCACQVLSELYINGERALAYTTDRLLNLDVPRGIEVIECNSQCSCDPHKCPNRVAQQPRDVPIEVFKTIDRGWGVRSSAYIKKGKVLGIYTGLLLRRDVAMALPEDEKAYLFDVDGRESRYTDADDPVDLYTVDAMVHGNWTRFLNHSCDPNLIVYLVVYDTIPDMNMPYIAFAATKDIPAGTEFLFDYDPISSKEFREKTKGAKGKSKLAIPKGRKPCSCGSGPGLCRGYV